jgi:tRNA threonylcarbamoyl adenosine modification protein YeaZ
VLVLVLDTATPACTAAVVDVAVAARAGVTRAGVTRSGASPANPLTAVTRAVRSTVDAKRHGELLAPSVRAVLADAGVRSAELAAVVAGTGPGPYTSLRIGVVTAAAFADAAGIPAFGVCSLDGIGCSLDVVCSLDGIGCSPDGIGARPEGGGTLGGAAAAAAPGEGSAAIDRVAAVTDARRREVFWAVYAAGRRVLGPSVGRPADVAVTLRESGVGAGRAVGPGALLYADVFGGLVDAASDPAHPDPAVLAVLAAPDIVAGDRPGPLVPTYLRRPDAARPRTPKPVTA